MKLLKSILPFALFFLGLGTINAQTVDAKKTVTKIVNKSADNVWTLLRKMDDIDKYSSSIVNVQWSGAKGVGGQRVCTAPEGNGYFKESIVGFDDENRTYSYALLEGVPVKGMVNSFKVVDLGYQKSMIVWTSNYDEFMQNPQMEEKQFLGFLDQSVNEMITNIVAAAK